MAEIDTLPPIGVEETTDEERRRQQSLPPVPRTPSQPVSQVAATQPLPSITPAPAARSEASGSGLVKSYAPGSPEYKAALGGASPDAMPAVSPAPAKPVAPPTPTALPPITGKAEMAAPSQPVQGSTMPAVGPQQKAYEDLSAQGAPKLSGWKKALDAIGSIFPIGRSIETAIPGSPQNYDARLTNAAMRAAREQTINKGEREERGAQENTRAGRQAFLDQSPEVAGEMTPFEKADFLATGKMPQKEPAAPKEAKEPPAKIAYHYTNKDGKEVSVYEDGTEKVGGEIQPKEQKENKAVAGMAGGAPAWAVQTEKGWVDPQTQKPVPNFKPAPTYGQTAPLTRTTNVLRKMPDGTTQLMAIHPDALQPGDVLASPGAGTQTMSKGAQFQEIHSGIDNLRSAIKNLDRPFTPEQIGKLTLAMKHTSDPTIFQTEIATLLGTQELTPAQEDLVIWMGHLNERALSLRNIAGMGQGSDQMRSAIQAILPSVKSGSQEMMNKQLAAFENQVQKLEKGVPKMPGEKEKPKETGGFVKF